MTFAVMAKGQTVSKMAEYIDRKEMRVYCKNCKYNNGASCEWYGTFIVIDGWCSRGEKREQDATQGEN